VAGSSPRVGVLALQGDVREHVDTLKSLGVEPVEVRTPAQFAGVDALVIPGGESTVIDKLTRLFDLAEPIKSRIAKGMPVFGTCAGLIMLAHELSDGTADQQTFGGLDVTVRRNAFGAQVDSFETTLNMPAVASAPVAATFIRAPIIERVGPSVEVLASLPDGTVVGARQGNIVGISFHPEVSGETRIHEYFLGIVRDAVGSSER
jgi:pyridoxal 5'-phosphate synthase pdxT subunit